MTPHEPQAASGQLNGFDQYGESTITLRDAHAILGHRAELSSAPAGLWRTVVQWVISLCRRRSSGAEPLKHLEIFRLQVEHARALLASGITEGRRGPGTCWTWKCWTCSAA